MPDLTPRVLAALEHGPLDHFQIAADLGEAPWLIRYHLKSLRRDRLVSERIRAGRWLWELTDRGTRAVHAARQMRLEVVR